MRRITLLPLAATLVASGFADETANAAAVETEVSFVIPEARAYAIRLPLRKEVIELAGLRERFDPCDPKEDPYRCDETRYNHEPNCPPVVAVGREGAAPDPVVAPGTDRVSGGAGDDAGSEEAPTRGSPIALNDLLSLGGVSRLGETATAAGLASSSYVDLSGRQDPEAHTESDAFTPNVRDYEERCFPRDGMPEDYVHMVSRSERTPSTYHLAECRGRECTFVGGAAIGSEAERGRTIVEIAQRGDKVVGRMEAVLKEASWGDGQLTIDLLRTVIAFSSDGTPEGLSWTVATTANGATLGGRPVTLAPGRVLSAGGLQAGVAAPYVSAPKSGRGLTIMAPGLFVAHQEQSSFFAGAEVTATLGRQPVIGFEAPGDDDTVGGSVGTPGAGGLDLGTPAPLGGTSTPPTVTRPAVEPSAVPDPAVSIVRLTSGAGPMVTVLGLAALAFLLLLVRWIGRYGWGRRLYRRQPLRGLDWLYRAFLKT